MSLKQKLSDEMVERLFGLMSSSHFMRLSNALWRQVNERQMAKLGATADWQMVADRIERLEQRAEQLQAKVEALRTLMDSREAGGGATRPEQVE